MNNNLILVSGMSGTGKSMCLRNIRDPEGVLYLNCESNKALPFKAGQKFISKTITDPYKVFDYCAQAAAHPERIHTVCIDTITFLMNMFESVHVVPSTNTQKAWGDYSEFFKNLMGQYLAVMPQRIIILGHTAEILDSDRVARVAVKVKGSLMNTGIESFFDKVISTKKMPVKKLEAYANPLLNITDKERRLELKHVFQTQITKETINEGIRGPDDMWTEEETFIDNDIQLVFDRIKEYY